MSLLNFDDVGRLRFREAETPQILVVSHSSVALILYVRGFTRDGTIDFRHTTSSNRSYVESTHDISEIPISLSVSIPNQTARVGQCYVNVLLTMAGFRVMTLAQGYVAEGVDLVFPNGEVRSSLDGPGMLRSITGTDPAAGAEVSESVPTNARWRLLSVRATLVTSVAVANRLTRWIIDDGTNIFFYPDDNSWQGAGSTVNRLLSSVQTRGTIGWDVNAMLPVHPVILFQGWRIRTVTENLQAGDDYSAPQLMVEEWIEE